MLEWLPFHQKAFQVATAREHIQPQKSCSASAAVYVGQLLQLLYTLSAPRLYHIRVSLLGHKTCAHVLDSWQGFIYVLLVSGYCFKGSQPAFRVYGLLHLRELRRNGPRKLRVVLRAYVHGLLCHCHCRQVSSMCL